MSDVAPAVEGVDGFPLKTDQDRCIDAMLRASEKAQRNGLSSPHVDIALRQAAGDVPAMVCALNARMRWLREQAPPPPKGRLTSHELWLIDIGYL